jgi:DNA ligase (NAD+)
LDPRVRIDNLKTEIRRHEEAYYLKDFPVISDAQFDALMRELRDLEEKHPQLRTEDSPTQRVGGVAAEKFARLEHNPPMLS